MDPLKVSARFAAYVWYTNRPENAGKGRAAARRFARENWVGFLPLAHEGWGRLLIKISRPRRARRRLEPGGNFYSPGATWRAVGGTPGALP